MTCSSFFSLLVAIKEIPVRGSATPTIRWREIPENVVPKSMPTTIHERFFSSAFFALLISLSASRYAARSGVITATFRSATGSCSQAFSHLLLCFLLVPPLIVLFVLSLPLLATMAVFKGATVEPVKIVRYIF
jgi:hypothetical protein